MGVRSACATAASVAVVRIAPEAVIVCVLKTLLTTRPCPFLPALFPNSATILIPQMSMPYSILGMMMLFNKRRLNLLLTPREGVVRQQQVRAYFVPLATALANCSLKWSSLSIIMPKNLCDLTGLVTWPSIVIGTCFTGEVFWELARFSCLWEH